MPASYELKSNACIALNFYEGLRKLLMTDRCLEEVQINAYCNNLITARKRVVIPQLKVSQLEKIFMPSIKPDISVTNSRERFVRSQPEHPYHTEKGKVRPLYRH